MVAFIRRLAELLLILAALATLGLWIHAGDWSEEQWIIVLFILWAISPYGAFFILSRQMKRSNTASWIASIGAVLAIAFGVGVLYDAFFVHLQNGIIFLFVPLYQWAGFTFVGLLSQLIAARSRRSSR